MEYSVVIPCAGKGSRMNLGYNKLLYVLGDKTVIEKTVDVFLEDVRCTQIVLVISESDKEHFSKLFTNNKIQFCLGGKERQESVYQGLKCVNSDYVLIHDGARPYLTVKLIDELLTTLKSSDACLLMVPAKDTMKVVDESNVVVKTLDRRFVMHAQTPQAFKLSCVLEAHEKAIQAQVIGTDDASLVEMFSSCPVKVVLGDYANIKITTLEDV